jgi:hypothetical protein
MLQINTINTMAYITHGHRGQKSGAVAIFPDIFGAPMPRGGKMRQGK